MGNQKFILAGMVETTLPVGASTEVGIGTVFSLPIAYYIKKIMLVLQNESALAKGAWVQWQVMEPQGLESTIEDINVATGIDLQAINPTSGDFAIHRPINKNNNAQFFFLDYTDAGTLIIEQYMNMKIAEHSDPKLEFNLYSHDGGNWNGESIDIHVVMECVVA